MKQFFLSVNSYFQIIFQRFDLLPTDYFTTPSLKLDAKTALPLVFALFRLQRKIGL